MGISLLLCTAEERKCTIQRLSLSFFILMQRRELDLIVRGISSFHVSLLACNLLSGFPLNGSWHCGPWNYFCSISIFLFKQKLLSYSQWATGLKVHVVELIGTIVALFGYCEIHRIVSLPPHGPRH